MESGWGKSGLTTEANNGFGIKAVGSQPFVIKQTREIKNGQSVYIPQKFAKYPTLDDGFIAHGKLLLHPQYAAALPYTSQPLVYTTKIAPVYAPGNAPYSTILNNLINGHNLTQYDV